MSGHSKWSQIKRQKAVTDGKRSNLFTKLGNTIAVAVKEGGKDPDSNFRLRMAIDKAKASNMPNDNIKRAIKRGAGEIEGVIIEKVVYEGFGPAGVAIIIEATTDNKNRTAAAIRNILTKHGGNLGGNGSVAWMFDKKGVLRVANEDVVDKDALELSLIDAGADEIITEDEGMLIYAPAQQLPAFKKTLGKQNITPASAETELVPQNKIIIKNTTDQKKLEKIFDELENDDDVSNYFTNADV